MYRNKHLFLSGFLSFLWPFGGLIYAFKNWNTLKVKNIIWLFCVYFGTVFVYTTGDSIRYAASLNKYKDLKIGGVPDMILEELDAYLVLVAFAMAKITENPQSIFIFFSFVFGFFYSRNLSYVFLRVYNGRSKYVVIFLLLYVVVNPIWNINIARYYTAAHVFVYGAMPIIYENKYSKVLWILLAALIHWSFLLPILVLALWIVVPKNINLFFSFFAFSLFVNTINIGLIDLSNLGAYGSRIGLYLNDNAINNYVKNVDMVNWHVKSAKLLFYWVTQFCLIGLFFVIKKQFKSNVSIVNLYTFSLFIYSISALFVEWGLPESYRFVDLASLFVLPVFILTVSHIDRMATKMVFFVLSLPLLFTIIYEVRTGFEFYGITLFIGNFFSASFVSDNVTIIEYLKNLF